jgi:hypothetical protein
MFGFVLDHGGDVKERKLLGDISTGRGSPTKVDPS